MKFGLEDRVIDQIIDILKTFVFIDKAVLYGSRAKGNYKEGSDIDLCLFGNDIDLILLHKVKLTLDDIFLPYSFDLSAYNLLKNPDLKSHIDRRGIVFFTAVKIS
ncbi:MAG: nucleotidyltransferase domain-containing protein [Parachlamydiaceae bacterium]|nr:nucleotidyltransferase domain-containing protein [Parachlamydiaceae bacterium]